MAGDYSRACGVPMLLAPASALPCLNQSPWEKTNVMSCIFSSGRLVFACILEISMLKRSRVSTFASAVGLERKKPRHAKSDHENYCDSDDMMGAHGPVLVDEACGFESSSARSDPY